MIEAIINGRKRTIGIHLYRGGKLMRRIKIEVRNEDNHDHNRTTIIGAKYALLSIKDKTEPVVLYVNAFLQRMIDMGFKSTAQKEHAEELRKIFATFSKISIKKFQDHPDHQQVYDLSEIGIPLPADTVIIN